MSADTSQEIVKFIRNVHTIIAALAFSGLSRQNWGRQEVLQLALNVLLLGGQIFKSLPGH